MFVRSAVRLCIEPIQHAMHVGRPPYHSSYLAIWDTYFNQLIHHKNDKYTCDCNHIQDRPAHPGPRSPPGTWGLEPGPTGKHTTTKTTWAGVGEVCQTSIFWTQQNTKFRMLTPTPGRRDHDWQRLCKKIRAQRPMGPIRALSPNRAL